MKILIACEFSEVLKEQFLLLGHDAHSCDLIPGEKHLPNHHQCDVRSLLAFPWDLMIAFPPCTYLCSSGARWWKYRQFEQYLSLLFILTLSQSPIPHIAIENPIGILSTIWRKPDQIIQPWQFGHPETKSTCLWLKNLPLLTPTNIVHPTSHRIHHEPPSPDRWKNRSRTYLGIAQAMSTQWANYQP